MQIDADQNVPKHFFFLGLRAPAGGAGATGIAEHVGVIALKQTVHAVDGSVDDSHDIIVSDEPYVGLDPEGPFRLEADLAPSKPDLDLVVVDSSLDDATIFGNAFINRGAGFGVAHPLLFGWLSRTASPRDGFPGKAVADGGDLDIFSATGDNLPMFFDNAFFNGGPIAGESSLQSGDQVRFTHTALAQTFTVLIPQAPTLAITQGGESVLPPVSIEFGVDTIVFDWSVKEFLLTWRGVFQWEDRLELAKLEIS